MKYDIDSTDHTVEMSPANKEKCLFVVGKKEYFLSMDKRTIVELKEGMARTVGANNGLTREKILRGEIL